jgi:DNA modification methylase
VKSATLDWPERTFRAGCALPRVETTSIERIGAEGGPIRLILGDALDVAGALVAEGLERSVDVVYVDPPYASQADYVLEARLDGPADGRVRRTKAYDDSWSHVGAYLDMLAPRLEACARLLSPSGTLWVHLDWRAAYLVRVLLDEIMGRDAFKNEIVWRRAPNLGRQAASGQFGRTLDTIVVYGGPEAILRPPTRLEIIDPAAIRRDDEGRPFTTAPRGDYTDLSIAKLEKEGRVHRASSGKVYIKYFLVMDDEGRWCRERRVDTLWTDVPPLRHAKTGERTGYPTQKPRALLERILRSASPPGGLAVDLFAGSGTTADAALASGRRAICADKSPAAISTARARLLRAKAALAIETCNGAVWPEAAPARVEVSRDVEGARVRLLQPREPLAWALDPSFTGPVFQTAWHSERAPGARATSAQNEALLRGASPAIGVRVFGDDGSVTTTLAG